MSEVNQNSTVLAQLARAFHFRDRHIFVRLYVQYVRPHLEFSSPAWSPWLEKDIECLENVQRRAVQMVTGLRGTRYEDKLTELGLTTRAERRHQTDMLQTYKILTGKDRVKSGSLFVMASANERATRSSADPMNLRVPASRL